MTNCQHNDTIYLNDATSECATCGELIEHAAAAPAIIPVYVAGNVTVHAGRKIGTYASGATRFAKLCGTSRNDRHEPMELTPDTLVTCKRCLAKLPKPAPSSKTRKWTATVSVAGQDYSDLIELTNDTLADTTSVAVLLAMRLIQDELGSDAGVVLYKQLKGDAQPKRDRSVYVYRAEDGTCRVQQSGA